MKDICEDCKQEIENCECHISYGDKNPQLIEFINNMRIWYEEKKD